jgi:hypothetical protein
MTKKSPRPSFSSPLHLRARLPGLAAAEDSAAPPPRRRAVAAAEEGAAVPVAFHLLAHPSPSPPRLVLPAPRRFREGPPSPHLPASLLPSAAARRAQSSAPGRGGARRRGCAGRAARRRRARARGARGGGAGSEARDGLELGGRHGLGRRGPLAAVASVAVVRHGLGRRGPLAPSSSPRAALLCSTRRAGSEREHLRRGERIAVLWTSLRTGFILHCRIRRSLDE